MEPFNHRIATLENKTNNENHLLHLTTTTKQVVERLDGIDLDVKTFSDRVTMASDHSAFLMSETSRIDGGNATRSKIIEELAEQVDQTTDDLNEVETDQIATRDRTSLLLLEQFL